MPAIAKKTVLCCALLCALTLASSAALMTPALASASETVAGAAVAPSGPNSASPGPDSAPAGSGSAPASASQTLNFFKEGISLATWFGPGLFGRHTACGQLLTKQLVGVANRSLPCGTLIAFSYRGHEVIVPVVDRGPYSSIGANWDLTQHAARLLKMGGTARLDAKVVGHLQNSPELGRPAAAGTASAGKPMAPVAGPTGGVAAS